jgi:outer membrane protein assembly factor BamE (lipoprotein component of BamABCDE complex)
MKHYSSVYHSSFKMHHAIVAVLLSAVCLGGCAPKVDNIGHINVRKDTSKIVVGESYKQDVMRWLGSPSTKSDFGEETWYYIAATREAYGFFKPETTDQYVTRIQFDKDGKVIEVKSYTLQDSKQIAVQEDITPTEGQHLGFWEQMMGNVGKFNRQEEAR